MKTRRLNKGERKKLYILLGVLFAVANLFAFSVVQRAFNETSTRLDGLQARNESNQAWLQDRDLWVARTAWLTEHQPKADEAAQGNVTLLESLQKQAKENRLSIVEQSLKDPAHTVDYETVSVQLRLSGSLESVCRWLTAIQQPDLFQEITDLSLKSEGDTEGGAIRCNLTVTRFYPLP